MKLVKKHKSIIFKAEINDFYQKGSYYIIIPDVTSIVNRINNILADNTVLEDADFEVLILKNEDFIVLFDDSLVPDDIVNYLSNSELNNYTFYSFVELSDQEIECFKHRDYAEHKSLAISDAELFNIQFYIDENEYAGVELFTSYFV